MKRFLNTLPNDYMEDRKINYLENKNQIIFSIIGVLIAIIIIAGGLLIFNAINGSQDSNFKEDDGIVLMLFLISGVVLIILLNLGFHYLFAYLFTKIKPTVGIKKGVFYTIVENTYLYRNTYAFKTIFSNLIMIILLLIPLFLIKDSMYFLIVLIFLGCQCGLFLNEMYYAFFILFKTKKDDLIKDLGNTLIIYKRIN